MIANLNGIKVHYEVHGRGDPVLFVHGFPLTLGLWTPLLEHLGDDRLLILPDLRGHGETEAAESATMADFADDLHALLDHVAPNTPACVVGLSMGGYIAFEFFRRHRSSVRALVLADTRPTADSPEAADGRRESARRVLAEGSHVIADGMIDKLFAPQASDDLRKGWYAIMSATSPAGVAAALRGLADRPDSRDTLPRIDVPTLILVGEHDAITTPDDARAMHDAIGGSRLEIIPGAGHMAPVEQPEPFAKALRAFLNAV
jgi:pimeloyl-ACP methyl ester carboxylesterase